MYTFAQAERAVEDATRPGASVTQREQALRLLLAATEPEYHADLALLRYATQRIPVLTLQKELEGWRETALGKAYDLMEGDVDEIRILGYQLALALGQQHGASMGEVTDVLSQALIASIDSEDYTPREQSELFLAVRLIIRLDPAALTIIIPAIIQDPASSPGKRERLCGYLERETFGVVGEVLRSGFGDGETEAAIRGECEAAITSGDPTIITFGVHLLAVLPSITGTTSTPATVNSITSLLVKCIEQSPSSNNAATIQSYFSQLSFLLSQTTHQPDPRWFLYLYCAKPLETARWAQKRVASSPDGHVHEAPNRLVDWLKESWNLWRLAHDKPALKAQVPPELQITELSRMCRVVLAQLPLLVPARITVASLAPMIDQLELQLLLAYFIFLKFRGQLEDIYDDRVKEILEQVTRAAGEALERTVDLLADPVKTRQWQNISRMSHNLVHKGSLDTIVPSWQVSSINLAATNTASTLGDDVVAIPQVSAPRATPQISRGNQQRRPPHAVRYFEDVDQSDSGTHLSAAAGSTKASPSIRSSSQFEMTERTASGSSTHSGSSKRKRDFANTQQQHASAASVGPATHPSRGLAERLGIALPPDGSRNAAHVEDGHDQDVQQHQNKKQKAKSRPHQFGQAGENGASAQRSISGAGNLTPGMSLLQRLNMGGNSNTTKLPVMSLGPSNGAQNNGRFNGQPTRGSPRVMPNALQRNMRPSLTQPIRPNAPPNSQPSLPPSLSQLSMNDSAASSAPSGPASNRLKLSTTPSNPASLISRLSGAPAHARSPILMAPIAPHDLVKSAALTSVDGSRVTPPGTAVSGNAREQIRPLGPAIGQARPAAVEPVPAALPFNPNDGIKRKGRGFANAGYAV
ncbi:hypothetical protein QFC21_004469 [Naganishia friedmannii]|uniref:Uncharacterized protein n=1 Tax=Naganishia friedmannii TaxID=89922 RepID=A0ACC2VFG7_9TREE|nr:hypothetical protein QFC21_004469 [Naganishia friedmannii]